MFGAGRNHNKQTMINMMPSTVSPGPGCTRGKGSLAGQPAVTKQFSVQEHTARCATRMRGTRAPATYMPTMWQPIRSSHGSRLRVVGGDGRSSNRIRCDGWRQLILFELLPSPSYSVSPPPPRPRLAHPRENKHINLAPGFGCMSHSSGPRWAPGALPWALDVKHG